MKKLIYLTNVQTPAGDAQSLQVQSMAKSFSDILGNDFILISPANKLNKELNLDFQWIKLKNRKFLIPQFKIFICYFKISTNCFERKTRFYF